ncbi:GNAT family N-acetyltransferase [Roseobacter weihaiensis]|uniref:GNAT family N-acetyltransferase n=1 Tax=Roseobacter weihaiensis TaxID=2763262 RepID=UPI001D0AFC2A|nr:GNAT family N-acetyltransferase [Roseobacter sp. H9]
MEDVTLRPLNRTDRDWLVDQHRIRYAQDEGFDPSFGVLVAEIVDAFLSGHDPEREAAWIAVEGDVRLGSIFCVRQSAECAKLRLFLLVPEARGKGLGRQLLETCMAFAKDHGYLRMQLWTHESHSAACALYKATGWQLESSKPVHSFGQDLVEQSWSYHF